MTFLDPDPRYVPETGPWHDESPPEKRGISALMVLAVLLVIAVGYWLWRGR